MKAQRRWMRSVIAAASLPQPALPYARQVRPVRAGSSTGAATRAAATLPGLRLAAAPGR